jgi:O-antigen/teichoic acid export membrane protein
MSWTLASSVVMLSVQLVYTPVISRLLDPAQFGIVAAALVLMRLVAYLPASLSSYVVQRADWDDEAAASTLGLGVLLGLTAMAAAWALSPLSNLLLPDTPVAAVVRIAALTYLFSGPAAVLEGVLRRQHQFRTVGRINLAAFTAGNAGVSIAAALAGAGVWSLVLGLVAEQVLRLGQLLALRPIHRRPDLRLRSAGRHIRSTTALAGSGLLDYFASSIDTLAVGPTLGAAAFGAYSRATTLVALPLEHVSVSFNTAIRSGLNRATTATEDLARRLLGAVGVGALLVVPGAALLAVGGPPLVTLFLGDQWVATAEVLPVVAVATALALLSNTWNTALESRGLLRARLATEVVHVAAAATTLGAALVLGAPTLTQLAAAWTASEAVMLVTVSLIASRLTGVRWRNVAQSYMQAVAVTVAPVAAGLALWTEEPSGIRRFAPGLAMAAVLLFEAPLVARWTAGGRELADRFLSRSRTTQ